MIIETISVSVSSFESKSFQSRFVCVYGGGVEWSGAERSGVVRREEEVVGRKGEGEKGRGRNIAQD